MPAPGAIRAGRAFVELFADDSKLVRGLRRASAKLKAFGESVRNMGLKMMALGAAIVAPLLASTKVFSKMGDSLAKMSARTGFSVEALSELGFAAELSGASVEDLEKSIRRMQATIVDAGQGLSTATDALETLGLTVKNLTGLTPEQQFKLIADRLAAIEDPTLRAATAMELFGRSGTMLLPMLAGGAAGIEELQKQARKFGLTISTKDAKAAERFTDTLSIMWKVVKQGVFLIGASLAPLLTDVAKWITKVATESGAWVKRNRQLIVTVLKLGAITIAFGAALVVLGTTITGLAKIFGLLALAVTGVGMVLKVLGAVLTFVLTPIGAVIATLVGLAGVIVWATGAGAKALAWLGECFADLRDDALKSYDGIRDALAAGDIALAARIFWLTLRLEWTKGSEGLMSIWSKLMLAMKVGFVGTMTALVTAGVQALYGLEVAWIEMTAFLSNHWAAFCTGFHASWMWVVKSLEETWNKIKGLFDKTFDVSVSNAAVEAEYRKARDVMWDEAKKQLAAREAKRESDRKRAKAIYEAELEVLKGGPELQKQLREQYETKIKTDEDELARLRKELADAITEAKKKRVAKEAGEAPGLPGLPGRPALPDIDDLLNKAKVSVMGTFNAAAMLSLQGTRGEDRIAKATEQTAKEIIGMRRDVRNNAATFV